MIDKLKKWNYFVPLGILVGVPALVNEVNIISFFHLVFEDRRSFLLACTSGSFWLMKYLLIKFNYLY